MVPACIISSANLYEQPRPPRRGSHRPGPPCFPPLNDWPHDRRLFVYQDYDAPPYPVERGPVPLVQSVLQQRPIVYWPDEAEPWKQDSAHRLLPVSATLPIDRATFTSGSAPAMKRAPRRVAANARPSLEVLRQLHGRVSDRRALEQSILESYARAAPQSAACQSTQKRCLYPSCTKISVSRGLCRGHGGGRRCHVPGCTKSAQSRSNFCWAHGGGQRCDVDGCMRSRKSKHYCVAHLKLEGTTPESSSASTSPESKTKSREPVVATKKATASRAVSPPIRALPSLGQALSSASRSPPNLPMRSTKAFLSV